MIPNSHDISAGCSAHFIDGEGASAASPGHEAPAGPNILAFAGCVCVDRDFLFEFRQLKCFPSSVSSRGKHPLQKCSEIGGLNVWTCGVMRIVLNIVLLQHTLPCVPLPRGRQVWVCPAFSVPELEYALVAGDGSRGGGIY